MGEMLALKLSDINVENKTAYLFGKGSKPRLVPVSKEIFPLFARYKGAFHQDEDKKAPPILYKASRRKNAYVR